MNLTQPHTKHTYTHTHLSSLPLPSTTLPNKLRAISCLLHFSSQHTFSKDQNSAAKWILCLSMYFECILLKYKYTWSWAQDLKLVKDSRNFLCPEKMRKYVCLHLRECWFAARLTTRITRVRCTLKTCQILPAHIHTHTFIQFTLKSTSFSTRYYSSYLEMKGSQQSEQQWQWQQ